MKEQQINLTLTVREADVILAALAKRPLEEVIDLFIKIKNQGASQIVPAEPEANDGGNCE